MHLCMPKTNACVCSCKVWIEKRQLAGGRGERKERSGKKEAKKQDARQSEAGVYYSARSVPHFYCYSHDLTSSYIKAALSPAYHRFASVQPEGEIIISLSRWRANIKHYLSTTNFNQFNNCKIYILKRQYLSFPGI